MAIKKSKRLAALAGRVTGTAYTGKTELPNLDSSDGNVMRLAMARMGLGKDPQSLVSDEGVIPLPDEDELEKVRRRRAARRGGGRASTVLSDDNRLGG